MNKSCDVCNFDKVYYKYKNLNVYCGEPFYENSVDAILLKYPNWAEIQMCSPESEEISISISYCPRCGRRL